MVYTNQTETKDLELTFAPIQPAPPIQYLPEVSPGLNMVNVYFTLIGGSNNSETSEGAWPENQDLFQKFEEVYHHNS